jgi:hypothetical protein
MHMSGVGLDAQDDSNEASMRLRSGHAFGG